MAQMQVEIIFFKKFFCVWCARRYTLGTMVPRFVGGERDHFVGDYFVRLEGIGVVRV